MQNDGKNGKGKSGKNGPAGKYNNQWKRGGGGGKPMEKQKPKQEELLLMFRLDLFDDVVNLRKLFTYQTLAPDVWPGFFHVSIGKVFCDKDDLVAVSGAIQEVMNDTMMSQAPMDVQYHPASSSIEHGNRRKAFWIQPMEFNESDKATMTSFLDKVHESLTALNIGVDFHRTSVFHITVGKYARAGSGDNYLNNEVLQGFVEDAQLKESCGEIRLRHLEFVKAGEEHYELVEGVAVRKRLASIEFNGGESSSVM